jgi:hypothetical protein
MIACKYPELWLRHHRAIERWIKHTVTDKNAVCRTGETEVYVLTGETGIGKSTFCKKYAHPPKGYWARKANSSRIFWDGY